MGVLVGNGPPDAGKIFGMDRPLRSGVDESEDSPFEKGDMTSLGPPMALQRGV